MRHFTEVKVELLGRPFPQIRGLSEETILNEDKLITTIGLEKKHHNLGPLVCWPLCQQLGKRLWNPEGISEGWI